jgi:quercetin dioxygenase-like cupin family protein
LVFLSVRKQRQAPTPITLLPRRLHRLQKCNAPASVLLVEIEADARSHDHREHTEIDYVMECAAGAPVELDGERIAVGPGGILLIAPGARHRAAEQMTILNVVAPPLYPADEWLD